jgi:hypothetical protein
MDYDSAIDTSLHINRVRFLLGQCAIRLLERGSKHDASKLEQPEKAIFDAVGNRLAVITYEGEEYKQSLAELKVALDHHYLQNTHHPDHYPNGIDGMSLFRSPRNADGLESGRRTASKMGLTLFVL